MKITILGAGMLGSQIAMILAMRGYDNVCLFDAHNSTKCDGECDDINQMLSVMEKDYSVTPAFTYNGALQEAGIVIMAVGRRRKMGQVRDDLWRDNRREVEACSRAIRDLAPDATVIILTNPVDRAYETVKRMTRFPATRIIKQGPQLDTARLREILSKRRGTRRSRTKCRVTGTHDEEMTLKYDNPSKEIDREAIYCAIDTIKKKGATVYAPAMQAVLIMEKLKIVA